MDSSASDWAHYRPGPAAGITLMQAHFTAHAFEKHSHDGYAIGATSSGVQTFHCRGALHASRPGDLILFNPDEAHDGQRGTAAGFGYSILYVAPLQLREALDADAGSAASRHFRNPVIHDPATAAALRRAVQAAGQPQEALRAEELTGALLVRVLQRHGEAATTGTARDPGGARLDRVRQLIIGLHAQDLTVARLAGEVGLSRIHLTRAFTQRFGVPPHVFLNSVRLHRARQAMLAGRPLADVAAATGFADQSHMSRRFKGAFGLSPAAWLRQMKK
jgi:AraC-like DNA-binding protein